MCHASDLAWPRSSTESQCLGRSDLPGSVDRIYRDVVRCSLDTKLSVSKLCVPVFGVLTNNCLAIMCPYCTLTDAVHKVVVSIEQCNLAMIRGIVMVKDVHPMH